MTVTPPEPLPLPVGGPATLARVKAQPAVTCSTEQETELQLTIDAVNDKVRGWPVSDRARGLDDWPAAIVQGATMLAVRLWRRRNTAGGVEVFGDQGIAYVRRVDPDVAQLLELGDWAKPAFG